MTTVKVYLNEGPNGFSEFGPRSELHLAIQFEFDQGGAHPQYLLNHVYEQLNIGGDLVPAEPWTTVYRANRNRSLSVGDVVVIGETAWAVARIGFETITTEALVAAIEKES
jgi:hypothetical protein